MHLTRRKNRETNKSPIVERVPEIHRKPSQIMSLKQSKRNIQETMETSKNRNNLVGLKFKSNT